jgi:hypothetical protein
VREEGKEREEKRRERKEGGRERGIKKEKERKCSG